MDMLIDFLCSGLLALAMTFVVAWAVRKYLQDYFLW